VRRPWDQLIRRAQQLTAAENPASSLLAFYGAVLRAQLALHDALMVTGETRLTGNLTHDLNLIRPHVPALLRSVAAAAPEPLASEARDRLEAGGAALDESLLAYWHSPSDREFFAKMTMQPYLCALAQRDAKPLGRGLARADNRCPFCGGAPQLSVLHAAPEGDGGGRSLLCAGCLTTWPFRRVLCPSCGEEDERKLGYFRVDDFDHVRIDACDSCRHYQKSIDLTRLGLAVPLVDDVATASLDVWARDRDYVKIELNLVGL